MKTLLEFVAVQVFVDANFGSQDVVTFGFDEKLLLYFMILYYYK